jgi:predicted DNA-binding protein
VPDRLYSKVKARAKSEGRPVSELAREALERYIVE